MEEVKEESKQQWKLESIRVYHSDYGDNKGKYRGSIKFKNKDGDNFEFQLDPETTDKYLKLISEQVIKSAKILGDKIAESLS